MTQNYFNCFFAREAKGETTLMCGLLPIKKLLTTLTLLLLLGSTQQLFAQLTNVTLGSGTSTSTTLPISPFYGYSFTEQIVLQSEIATAGNITKVRFYYTAASSAFSNSNNWTIYLGHTTKTQFASTTDWILSGAMTQVFSGTVSLPASAGWMEITLSTPFAYNNTDNLVIAVDENASGYNESSSYFRSYAPSSSNRSIYYRSDSTNPDPASITLTGTRSTSINQMQIQVEGTNPGLAAGTMSAFGNVCLNANGGPNNFSVSGINLTGDITVEALSGYSYSTTSAGTYTSTLTLSPSSGSISQTVYVQFTPTSVASYSGNIVVSGGGASSVNVAASGAGVNTAPSISTNGSQVSATFTSVGLSGTTISNIGCSTVTSYGIEYSTTSGFATGTGTQVAGSGFSGSNGGTFTTSVTGLTQATTYYYKAYTVNSGGTTYYSSESSFTTATPDQVGVGTSTSTNFPITVNYGYNYTQQIYLASELTAVLTAGETYITKIRFKPTTVASPLSNYNNWTVYFANSTKTTFSSTTDWLSAGSMTQVFTGLLPTLTANTWMELTLDTPFLWDGSSNLVVGVYEGVANYSTPANAWSSYTAAAGTGEYRGIYYRSDSNNPSPSSPPSATSRSNNIAQVQFDTTTPPSCNLPASTNISVNASTLVGSATWTAPAAGTTPTYYEWELRTSGTAGSGATGLVESNNTASAGTINFATTLTANTTYYFYIRSYCGGSTYSDWSTGASLYSGYCTPTGATNYYITNFTTTGGNTNISNATGANAGYGNFTAQSVSQYAGGSVNFSITPSSGTNYYYIWVDWNNDFDFSDAGETLVATTSYASSYSGSYTVSGSQAAGSYRMRVANSYSGAISSCGPASYGEYEDYIFTVEATPSCYPPQAPFAVSAITTTGATLDWVAAISSPSNGYDYYFTTSSSENPNSTSPTATGSVAAGNTTAVVTGILTPGTTYYWWVRGNCNTTQSIWKSGGSFTSAKLEPSNYATNFAVTSSTTASVALSYTAATGTVLADGYLLKANTSSSFVTPVDGTDPGTGSLSMSTVPAQYKTTGTSATFTTGTNGTMYYFTNYSYTNSGTAIDFKTDGSVPTLNYATKPATPTSITFSSTAVSSATIGWTLPASFVGANHTVLVFVKSGSAVTAGTPVANPASYSASTIFGSGTAFEADAAAYAVYNGDGNSVTVTGLSAATNYYVRVLIVMEASNYDATYSYSAAGTASGSTPYSVPYSQNFDAATSMPAGYTSSASWTVSGSSSAMPGNPGNTIYKNLYGSVPTASFTTVAVGALGTDDRLTFNYRTANYSSPYAAPAADSGNFIVAVSTDFGSTWTDLTTVTNDGVDGWQYKEVSLAAYAGQYVKVRFTGNRTSGDYYLGFDNLTIEAVPSCEAPTSGFDAYDITTNGVTLNWDDSVSLPSTYDFYVSDSNVAPDSGTTPTGNVTGSGGQVSSGLTSNTVYYWWVRSVCAVGNESSWAAGGSFTTLCEPAAGAFTMNFDAGSAGSSTDPALYDCWSFIDGGSGYGYVYAYSTPYSSPNHFYMYNSSDLTADYILVSPETVDNGSGGYRVKFFAKGGSSGYSLQFGTMSDPADGATFTLLQTITLTATHTEYTVNLPNGTDDYFAFRHGAGGTYRSVYVDDVSYEALPSCVEVTEGHSISSLTNNTVDLNWTASISDPSSGYEYYVSTSATDPDSGTSATGTVAYAETTASVTGLTAQTTYYWWVRANCGGGDYSIWTSGGSFTTACDPMTSDFSENFDAQATGSSSDPSLPDCWSFYDGGTGYGYVSSSYSQSTSNSFYIYNSSDSTGDYILVSPLTEDLGSGLYKVTFYARSGGSGYNLLFGTMSTATDGATFTTLQTISLTTTFTEYSFIIPATTDDYFAFKHGLGGTYRALYIDTISYEALPPCVDPEGATATENITPNSADISWTASYSDPANGYEYYVSTSNVDPTGATTPTGTTGYGVVSASLTGLTPNSTYYWWVRANCNGVDYSNWISGGSFFTGYCAPSSVATSDYINSFTTTGAVTDLSNTSSGFSAGGYGDFTAQTLSQVIAGTVNFDATVTSATGASGFYIWVDWDEDYVFEATELVYTNNAVGATTLSDSFDIPETAVAGTYRMRVRYSYDYMTTPSACSSVDYGEAEDYTLVVPEPCTALIESVTGGSVCGSGTVNLTAVGSSGTTEYRWYAAATGGSALATTVSGSWTTPSVSTTTTYYVSSYDGSCESDNRTAVVAVVYAEPTALSITPAVEPTGADSCTMDYMALTAVGGIIDNTLLNIDFNNGMTDLANGGTWTTVNSSTGGTPANAAWTLRASGYNQGSEAVYTSDASDYIMTDSDDQGSGGTTDTELISPEFSLSGYTSVTLTFKHYYRYSSGQTAEVQVSTNSGSTWTTVTSYTSTAGSAATMTSASQDLSSYGGEASVMIRFKYTGSFDWYWAVDDIQVNGTGQVITWSPATGLYTDTSLTTAYVTDESAVTVYALPSGSQQYTATANSPYGCDITANTTVDYNGKTFIGTDGDWTNAANWSPAGVPDDTNCVIVPDTKNINVTSGTAYTERVNVKNGGSVTISEGANLIVTNQVDVLEGGSLTIANNANLIQVNNVANSGDADVYKTSSELYRLDYTIWSSPVVGQNLLEFSPMTVTSRFYDYDESQDIYTGIQPLNNDFQPGYGYLIRMPNDHPDFVDTETPGTSWPGLFTGVLNNGNISVPVTNTLNGYNLVGNPYPSPINVHDFYTGNSSVIESGSALYFWRKRNDLDGSSTCYATVTMAAYTANTAAGGDTNNGSFDGDPSDWVINPGQGFFVKVDAGTAINFTNSMRVPVNNEQFFRTVQDEEPIISRLWLNLTGDQGTFRQAAIAYNNQTTLGIDYGWDGRAFTNDGAIAIYTTAENEDLAVQARGNFVVTDVVPVGYKVTTAGSYTISLDHFDGLFEQGQDIYLKDNLTDVMTNLRQSNYSFSTDAGTLNDRFEVWYMPAALGTDNPVLDASQVVVYQKDGVITIDGGILELENVTIFDTRGRLLYSKNDINNVKTEISDLVSQQQMLIINITTEKGKVTKKVVY